MIRKTLFIAAFAASALIQSSTAKAQDLRTRADDAVSESLLNSRIDFLALHTPAPSTRAAMLHVYKGDGCRSYRKKITCWDGQYEYVAMGWNGRDTSALNFSCRDYQYGVPVGEVYKLSNGDAVLVCVSKSPSHFDTLGIVYSTGTSIIDIEKTDRNRRLDDF